MDSLSRDMYFAPEASETVASDVGLPIATIPKEILVGTIFSYLGARDLGRVSQVCRGFNVLSRTVWQMRAREICRACAELLSSFGSIPPGPTSSPEEAAAFLNRTVRRVKEINDSLPEDLRSTCSAHDLVCGVGPRYMQEFLQKAYDHSLRTMFGELARVPEDASLEESVHLIKDWLQTAEAREVDSLDLLYRELCCLPKELGQLTALRRLSLDNNRLESLPREIGQLLALQQLVLNSNQLASLPTEIGQLTALQQLCLGSNQLTSLPREIGQLTAVQILDLDNNQLTSLPPVIEHMAALQELFLGSNRLASLPPEIGQLASLNWLILPNNQFACFPAEIGQLTALERLDLSKNQLASLPPEVGQLKALLKLDISGNQLASLPQEIGQLTRLQRLCLSNNPIEHWPRELGQLTARVEDLYQLSMASARIVSTIQRAVARLWPAVFASHN